MIMPAERCPRCGRDAETEELGTTTTSVWMHCGTCGYVWRAPGPGLDAFSLILAGRGAVVIPLREELRPDVRPRAARYLVRLPVRYRLASDALWHHGLTENVSRSGVLFRADGLVAPRTAVDLILVLPGGVSGEPASRVRCVGEVVRAVAPELPHASPAIAAAVGSYELAVGYP